MPSGGLVRLGMAMISTQLVPLSLGGEWSWLTSLEDAITSVASPLADFIGETIFYAPSIFGVEVPLIVFWLVAAATIFTIYFKGIQFHSWKTSYDLVRGRYTRETDPGEVSHFQALTSAVSGTVGLGNIAGVAVAVSVGGPGATFWMIVAGLLGMCTKFVECTLGVKYREVHEDGTVTGGPFRYLAVAFARFPKAVSRGLTLVFAVALFLFGAVGGNMLQANQSYAQLREATGGDDGLLASDGTSIIFGVVLALLVAAVILGGIKSIGRVTSRLVPFMGIFYVVACLIVIVGNAGQIAPAIGSIITGAFNPDGVAGGAIGVLIVGFQRAAFSNEAGVGSAPTAHAAVKTRHPVSEGFVALLEPFVDTVIICTMTALTIVIADVPLYSELQKAEEVTNDGGVLLTSASLDTFLPFAPQFLALAVLLFAFSTLVTWSYYTLKAWTTLFGRSPQSEFSFKVVYCLFTVLGAVVSLGSVFDIADGMLFLAAIVNLLGCYILLPKVRDELRSFVAGLRSGEIAPVPVAERNT